MGEVAFKVVPGSKMYDRYFTAKEEKEKFHQLAKAFFIKHNLYDDCAYLQTDYLALELKPKDKKRFAQQLKKHPNKLGMWLFKKNSPMQKEWTNDVVSHIAFEKLHCNRFWYFNLSRGGRYALWHQENEIYGYLDSEYDDFSELPDYLERIPLSEYYRVRDGE